MGLDTVEMHIGLKMRKDASRIHVGNYVDSAFLNHAVSGRILTMKRKTVCISQNKLANGELWRLHSLEFLRKMFSVCIVNSIMTYGALKYSFNYQRIDSN